MDSSSHSMLRGTLVVSSLTLLSRILGFVREILVARLFGASFLADALFVAFRIPNLLRSIFAEGALTSAFVPVFAGELNKSHAAAREAMRSVSALLIAATSLVSILGIIYAPEVVSVIAPGFEGERYDLCVLLTRILMPYILCVSIVALLNGALNSVQIFGVSAFAQVVMNLVLIAGAIVAAYFEAADGAVVLAVSALAGGVLQVLAQIPALRRSGFSAIPSLTLWSSASKQVVHLMLPAILGAAVYQLSIFLSTQLASVLQTGSVAWLSYADRLTQLPIGVFAIALSSVLLPTLSNAQAEGNTEAFKKHLIDALRFTSFVMIPVALSLFVFSEPLIQVLFQRGNFDAAATLKTALAVKSLSIGLWAVSCHSMLVRACNAQKDTKTPTLIGVFALFIQLLLSLFLMGDPQTSENGTFEYIIGSTQGLLYGHLVRFHMGHAGLALSSSLTFFCAMTALVCILHRRIPDIPWMDFFRATLQALAASFCLAILCVLLKGWIAAPLMTLVVALPVAALSYFAIMLLLKSKEASEILGILKRRAGF